LELRGDIVHDRLQIGRSRYGDLFDTYVSVEDD
jgi:hypothetical protein